LDWTLPTGAGAALALHTIATYTIHEYGQPRHRRQVPLAGGLRYSAM
jgi:hypothetical protein